MTTFERIAAAFAPHYQIERELGHGALGTTWRAKTADGRPVAVKVLSADLVALMREPSAFVDTMRRVARVQHPSLVPLLDAGASGAGHLYYAMALQEGGTARERLEREGIVAASVVAAIGGEACDALAAAHAEGLTHGTLAPGNLHLGADRARIADVGVHAALVAAGIEPAHINALMGAPQYMSPEQLAGETPDARSDVYSLGALLYELLTGKPPFGGRTTSYVIAAVLAEEPAAPEGDPVAARVTETVLRAIEKAPADRWSGATVFGRALREEQRPGTPASTPSVEPGTMGRSGCASVVAIAAAGVGLAAAAAAFTVLR